MGLKISGATAAQTQNEPQPLKNTANKNNVPVNANNNNGGVYDKKAGGANIAALNKQKLNEAFNAQQANQTAQVKPKDELDGVTTESVFPKTIEKDESQESVLRRSYHEFAFKAHLSTESEDAFVESRIKDNKLKSNNIDLSKTPDVDTNELEAKIYHSKTGEAFTPTEWKERQEYGSINMSPTSADIAALKDFKARDSYNDGTKLADRIDTALNHADALSLDTLYGNVGAKAELHEALDMIKKSEGNANLQRGLVEKLGADKFLRLESMLQSEPEYKDVMKNSLSTSNEATKTTRGDAMIAQSEIAQRADASALARLTSNESRSQSTGFLVEAGKRVVKEGVGWETKQTSVYFGGTQGQIQNTDEVKGEAKEVLQNIAKNPQASTELLQDENFVKNGLKTNSMGTGASEDKGFNAILVSGTSSEARAANPRGVDNALRVTADALRKPDDIKPLRLIDGQNLASREMVSSGTADALAKVYENNADAFSSAAGRKDYKDELDSESVKTIFSAINQHDSAKEKAGYVTQVITAQLLDERPFNNEGSRDVSAGTLIGTVADAESRTAMKDAADEDKRQQTISKNLEGATDIITKFGLEKKAGIHAVIAGLAAKQAVNVVSSAMKTHNTEDATKELDKKYDDGQGASQIAVLTAYESAAQKITSGERTATPEQKAAATKFLANLRTYDNELDASEKILNANGRLIDASQASINQKGNMEGTVVVSTNSKMGDRAKAKAAAEAMSGEMKGAYESLRQGITDNLKRR